MTSHPSGSDLRDYLTAANPSVLIASLASITGDAARARSFLPHLSHGFDDIGITAALPAAESSRLLDWAVEVMSELPHVDVNQGVPLADDVFAELASGLVGWPVETGSAPFLREQAGFATFVETVERTQPVPEGFTLAIVGGGMAGIAQAIAAKQAGINFVLLEKKSSLGGVWTQNTYPGVGVDTPSRYYSFSFEVNPDWTHAFPEGSQYLDYLNRVAVKYGVLDSFEFGAEVSDLHWDEDAAQWQVSYTQARQRKGLTADAVVTAAGYLTNTQLPDVPGLDRFAGTWFHSADWDHDYDFAGKSVAVVGTGCTSVQIVDSIAETAGSITLFQRQPHWVMPNSGAQGFSDSERWLHQHVPTFATWTRLLTFIPIGDANYQSVRYDPQWAATHDLSISEANDRHLQMALGHLESSFADRPDLLEVMKPNFAPFGKRPVRDPGRYYQTLKKDTSTVVTSGLGEIVPEGILDGAGNLHKVDVIIYATGFALEYLSAWTIVGRDGHKLNDVWQDSPLAYNGCQVPGFPNLFITSGPHANPSHGGGHNFTVEGIVHYVIESLQTLFETESRSIDVTPEAQERWGQEMREALADSVWVRETRATTYYRNTKGEVILASPLQMEDYWTRLRRPNLDDVVLM